MKVKTLFKGQVGVAVAFVQACVKDGRDLIVEHDGKTMTIPHAKIRESIKGKSDMFRDRYGRDPYYLLYFVWRADPEVQGKLL